MDETELSIHQKARKQNGAAFEKRIQASCHRYRVRNLAIIEKVATPFRTIRKGSKMLAIPAEKSTVDFVGQARLEIDGALRPYPVAFEAKHCSGPRFALASVQENQRAFLAEWSMQGGIAFVLLEMGGEVYRIDWDEFATLEQTLGRKSIPLDWLKQRTPCRTMPHGWIDFLGIAA